MERSIPAQIVDAIKGQDTGSLARLLRENSEQVSTHTPFGGQTWLGYAAQIGNLDAVRALIETGSDVNAGDKRDNIAPICSAAANGHEDVVGYLLRVGAVLDVSKSVRNPIFAAIVGRSPQIVRLLLEAGIDGTVRYDTETMTNVDAVAFALMRGEAECARVIAMWNAGSDESAADLALKEADKIAEINANS
jgi:ankyrin repeat protein